MDEVAAPDLLAHVRSLEGDVLDFLERLVLAESPSHVPESQHRVFELLGDALDGLGFDVRHLPGDATGGQLYAVPEGRERHRPGQLLLGHSDTVWPLGTLKEMPLEISDGTVRGPGVFDMKAGLAQIVFALRALDGLGLEPDLTPVVFINSDEEVGSVESSSWIRMLARRVSRAFVLEPALGPQGKLKTARKGIGQFQVTVRGKAAHAGLDPEGGASAILELSHVIQKLFALNDPARGVSVNVGVIDGGLRPNVIAPISTAQVDVRVPTPDDARRIEEAILGLEASTPGVSVEVEGGVDREPLVRTPRNRAVWRAARRIADEMGLEIDEGVAGGGSDGNTTSRFTATLDGLGAVGDGAHASHEHIDVPRTLERCALLAALLMESPLDGHPPGESSPDDGFPGDDSTGTATAETPPGQTNPGAGSVAGAKLTGAGRYRDVLAMGDAGADMILDFVDAGLPSTACPVEEFREAGGGLLSRLALSGADVAVVEVGASPLERYNGAAAMDLLGDAVAFRILCASDPYAAIGVIDGFEMVPDVVTGLATSTQAGVELVEKLTGLPAVNVLGPGAGTSLRELLLEAIPALEET